MKRADHTQLAPRIFVAPTKEIVETSEPEDEETSLARSRARSRTASSSSTSSSMGSFTAVDKDSANDGAKTLITGHFEGFEYYENQPLSGGVEEVGTVRYGSVSSASCKASSEQITFPTHTREGFLYRTRRRITSLMNGFAGHSQVACEREQLTDCIKCGQNMKNSQVNAEKESGQSATELLGHLDGGYDTASQSKAIQIEQELRSTSKERRTAAVPKRDRRQWKTNMLLIFLVEFSGETSRGLVLPSLFMLNSSLGGTVATMGVLTALFSLGRFLSSTVLGKLADDVSFRMVFATSMLIGVASSLLYILSIPSTFSSLLCLYASRFLAGFGAGNRSVCRAAIAAMTGEGKRFTYLTLLSLCVYVGFAVTPGLGGLRAITDVELSVFGFFTLDRFSFPGFALMVLNCVGLLLLLLFWKEEAVTPTGTLIRQPSERLSRSGRSLERARESKEILVSTVAEDGGCVRTGSGPATFSAAAEASTPVTLSPTLATTGVALFVVLNCVTRGMLAVFETIITRIYLYAKEEDPSEPGAVADAAVFQFKLGIGGVLVMVWLLLNPCRLRELTLNVSSLAVMAVGMFVLGAAPIQSISMERLTAGLVLFWSVGSPIASAVIITSFSKMLGSSKQGAYMGYLGSAGSLGRIVFPLLPAIVAYRLLFLELAMVSLISLAALVYYQRLVTHYWRRVASYAQLDSTNEHTPLVVKVAS